MRDSKGRSVPVILYSTSFHRWEVWQGGSVQAHGSLENCQRAYPAAQEPTEMQYRLATQDAEQRST